jgi:flagella basal body P-ring formation protein FlgA
MTIMASTRLLLPLVSLLLATPASSAELKSTMIHVSAAMVTLGDVFTGAADPAVEIAKAPPAGKTSMIDYSTLSAIAASNHVDWHQPGLNGKIIICRDAEAPTEAAADGQHTVPTTANLAAAAEPLKAAMLEQHIADKMAVTFDPGLQQHYLANLPAEAALVVESLDYTPPTHKFTAVMVDAVSGERQALTGRAIPVIDVPVPTHPIREGELIRTEDLTTIEINADKVRSDTAQNSDTLVGKVAKRALDISQQIQTRFVGQPVLIKRGDRVTMVIQNGPMVLTAEGRALDDAGLGDTVRLVNAASNRNLSGVVTASGMVEVHTGSAMVAALTPAALAPTTVSR